MALTEDSETAASLSELRDRTLQDTEDVFSSQLSPNYLRPNHWMDRYGLTVAFNPRTEFVEILRAGLLGNAPQRPHINLIVQRHRDSSRV